MRVENRRARIASLGSFFAVITLAVILASCHGFFVNPTLQSITISPGSPSVVKGQTVQLSATGVNTDGSNANHLPNLTWSSSDATVATINTNGLVTGIAAGTATITATSGTVSGTATVTVTNSAVTSISITPTVAQISVSGLAGPNTQQFTANAKFADGSNKDITNSATWTSSNQAAATISTNGLAQAVAAGTTTITASSGNVTSNGATLTVSQ